MTRKAYNGSPRRKYEAINRLERAYKTQRYCLGRDGLFATIAGSSLPNLPSIGMLQALDVLGFSARFACDAEDIFDGLSGCEGQEDAFARGLLKSLRPGVDTARVEDRFYLWLARSSDSPIHPAALHPAIRDVIDAYAHALDMHLAGRWTWVERYDAEVKFRRSPIDVTMAPGGPGASLTGEYDAINAVTAMRGRLRAAVHIHRDQREVFERMGQALTCAAKEESCSS
jgi:hypothetical protein